MSSYCRFAALALTLCPLLVCAQVSRSVSIDSTPSGAQVYLLQAGKRTLIGTTPTRAELEFHSEKSVLRLFVTKTGYEGEPAEVSAKDEAMTVPLRPQRIAADHRQLTGEAREVQQRLAPKIEEVMRVALAKGGSTVELAGQITVVRLDGGTFLLVPAAIGTASSPPAGVSREVWDRVSKAWLQPLAEIARHETAITATVIDVRLGAVTRNFSVDSKMESRLEMECMAGTEYVKTYEPCVRQVERSEWSASGREYRRLVCEPGMVDRPVFNSCLTRVPVTRTEVIISPDASTRLEQARIRYLIPAKLLSAAGDPYGSISFQRFDSKGQVVEKQGEMPAALPGAR